MPNVPTPHDVIATHQEAIGNAAASLQRALQAARQPLENAYSALQQRSSDMLHDTQDYIEHAPFKALTYALAVGLVLGVVLGAMFSDSGDEDDARR